MVFEKPVKAEKCYVPSRAVQNTLRDMLLFEQEKNKRLNKINAGKKLTDAERKAEEREFQNDRLLDKRKVEILNNYIFPSMANLITFLEYAALPELRGIFDNDIAMLFFGVPKTKSKNDKIIETTSSDSDKLLLPRPPPELQPQPKRQKEKLKLHDFAIDEKTVFRRFIYAILGLSKSQSVDNIKSTDFRFMLLDILQREVWEMIRSVAPDKFKSDLLFYNNIVPDIGRAVGWTSYLSREALAESTKTNFNQDKRPVLF